MGEWDITAKIGTEAKKKKKRQRKEKWEAKKEFSKKPKESDCKHRAA